MRTAAVAFVASTATAAVLTPLVRNLAHRCGLLDHALTSRKIHGKPIPRLGGIAIVLAFFAPLVALLFVNSGVGSQFYAMPRRAFGLFAGGLAIAALGVLDDLRGTGAKTKFRGPVRGRGRDVLARLPHRRHREPVRPGHPARPARAAVHAPLDRRRHQRAEPHRRARRARGRRRAHRGRHHLRVIALNGGEPLMVLFTAALAGAVLGFLFYNFNPATIFMGDTGLDVPRVRARHDRIQTNRESSRAVAILVPIIALGVPIADTLLAMARRAARGAPLFSADRGHIHHRLLDLGLSHRRTVLVIYGASAVLGAVAVLGRVQLGVAGDLVPPRARRGRLPRAAAARVREREARGHAADAGGPQAEPRGARVDPPARRHAARGERARGRVGGAPARRERAGGAGGRAAPAGRRRERGRLYAGVRGARTRSCSARATGSSPSGRATRTSSWDGTTGGPASIGTPRSRSSSCASTCRMRSSGSIGRRG